MNKGDETVDNKSRFLNSAEKMAENLGPALCLAKWKQVSLHLPTGLNNSCYHPPLHKIPVENLATNPVISFSLNKLLKSLMEFFSILNLIISPNPDSKSFLVRVFVNLVQISIFSGG